MRAAKHDDLSTQRARRVAEAPTEIFSELIAISGLDPSKALRFANCSGVDFKGSDLRGFDFTGARLHGCDFSGALIAGARFDQAEIDQADSGAAEASYLLAEDGSPFVLGSSRLAPEPPPTRRTNLRAAADWDAYIAGWRRPARLIGDAHLPVGAVFQDAPFAPELVIVPPGEFMMGSPPDEPERLDSEGPQHPVTIAQAFAVGRYAVTFDEWDFARGDKEWRKITGLKARKPKDEGWGRGNRPVINVSWEDAQAYAIWLRAKTGREYRLLTEAEWEYAARAGTATPFWWGSSITPAQANYNGNHVYEGGGEKGEYRGKTVPVDAFAPNPFGLYQVHGNVWEWVEDVWHNSYEDKPEALKANGNAWTTEGGGPRVLRGGSWDNDPRFLRSALRIRFGPDIRNYGIGFRVARTLTP